MYGAGHLATLRHFVESSPEYRLVEVAGYTVHGERPGGRYRLGDLAELRMVAGENRRKR